MIIVIIAGGSGTRLWPLSTSDYPKHLLKLTNENSLLQNTYARSAKISDKIYIVSEASHSDHIYSQLPELPADHVIVEAGRRGTASCVIGALSYIKSSCDENEPIVFMHSDHHIRDTEGFIETVERSAQIAIEYNKLLLLGVEPTYAATGFGYIERGKCIDHSRQIFDVKSFKEKPDLKTATNFLSKGNYLWNMGFFVASIGIFEKNIQSHAPKLWSNYKKLLDSKNPQDYAHNYLQFDNEPIDTALIERINDLIVIPGSFDWMDVGSYVDVHQVNLQDENGNTLQGNVQVESLTNSMVRNDTDVPVAVIGLDNVAVISTPDGILVTNKGHSQKVGDVAKRI